MRSLTGSSAARYRGCGGNHRVSRAASDAWKAEFEKSLFDSYGKRPVKYEDLGNFIYQVYVEHEGRVIPFVTVDSATGDYHG